MEKVRCPWPKDDPLYMDYHDKEWGVPIKDDQQLFEKLILDGFQAGLSWITILRKRENFIAAFDGFDPQKIARYNERKIQKLMTNAGIIRNQLKIRSTVTNAKVYLEIMKNGSFSDYLWQFTNGKTKVNHWKSINDLPATSAESDEMSKALKKTGFKFCGSTICYAFMQAVGMVDDHLVTCFRHTSKR